MTEKLFYQDPYLFEFDAAVLACRPEKEGYAITLDRTAFYPEGGGQLTDLGFLNDIPVTFVKEIGEEIYHFCPAPLEAGTQVHGRVDAPRRFDLMQQHSGEHIASGLICAAFHCDNVGFHISDPFVIIDYNASISWEELKEIELAANRYIWENRPMAVHYPSEEALHQVEFRSKKELKDLSGDIRIVEFPGADICACCGTHVKFSGEVGLIKFISCVPHRGGVRIEMLSGGRALRYVDAVQSQNHQISVALSAKETETAAAVERLKKEALSLKERLAVLETRAIEEKAAALAGKGPALLLEENMSVDSVRRLADAVMQSCGGFCAVLSDCGEDGIRYAMGQEGGDLRELVKALNEAFSGRGGGKPHFVQGTLRGDVQKAAAFIREALGVEDA